MFSFFSSVAVIIRSKIARLNVCAISRKEIHEAAKVTALYINDYNNNNNNAGPTIPDTSGTCSLIKAETL